MQQALDRPNYFLPGLVVGSLFGGVIGGLVALWLAPQSGHQLQTLVNKQVHKQGKALKHQADAATSQLYGQFDDTVIQAAEQVETLRKDGERFLNHQVEILNQAAMSAKKSLFN